MGFLPGPAVSHSWLPQQLLPHSSIHLATYSHNTSSGARFGVKPWPQQYSQSGLGEWNKGVRFSYHYSQSTAPGWKRSLQLQQQLLWQLPELQRAFQTLPDTGRFSSCSGRHWVLSAPPATACRPQDCARMAAPAPPACPAVPVPTPSEGQGPWHHAASIPLQTAP